jgi:hypothetical protein
MADAALFIGWGEIVRGRETEAAETFTETIAYWARLQEEGVIEAFEPVFLEPHGGDLQGFFFLRGDAEKLAILRVDEEFGKGVMRASLIADGVGSASSGTGARRSPSTPRRGTPRGGAGRPTERRPRPAATPG